jgi:phage FluMu protein gp41
MRSIAFQDILAFVAAHRALPKAVVFQLSKISGLVRVRDEVWWLARRHTALSLPQIGQLSDRDHTTVLAGLRRIEGRMAEDAAYAAEMRSLSDGLVAAARLSAAARARDGEPLSIAQARAVAERIVTVEHPALHASGSELRAMAASLLALTETTKEAC